VYLFFGNLIHKEGKMSNRRKSQCGNNPDGPRHYWLWSGKERIVCCKFCSQRKELRQSAARHGRLDRIIERTLEVGFFLPRLESTVVYAIKSELRWLTRHAELGEDGKWRCKRSAKPIVFADIGKDLWLPVAVLPEKGRGVSVLHLACLACNPEAKPSDAFGKTFDKDALIRLLVSNPLP
jgi:hypothetical protein